MGISSSEITDHVRQLIKVKHSEVAIANKLPQWDHRTADKDNPKRNLKPFVKYLHGFTIT